MQKLKEKSNTRPILKEILRSSLIIKESRRYRKEKNHNWKVNHLNKPVDRSESNDNHNGQQKDEHEDVKEDIKVRK